MPVDDTFEALAVVSPLVEDGEEKNQDRARWFPHVAVATVCDGTSSSARSAEAAQLVADLSPMLFGEDTEECLRGICRLLTLRRAAAQHRPVKLAPGLPPAMQELMSSVARERMSSSYQTTMVSASFTFVDEQVSAEIVRCGDSALFAYSPSGELLLSSPPLDAVADEREGHGSQNHDFTSFGPGDELLVKVLGTLTDHPEIASRSGVQARYASRWVVCMPLDQCERGNVTRRLKCDVAPLMLRPGTLLLTPRYNLERHAGVQDTVYRRLRFATAIRAVQPSDPVQDAPQVVFGAKSNLTAVLPEHVLSGRWVHRTETVPADTHFVLASDGFYGAFDSPGEQWKWLIRHGKRLCDHGSREQLLQKLHARLRSRDGDDDISFIWVSPSKSPLRHETSAATPSAEEE